MNDLSLEIGRVSRPGRRPAELRFGVLRPVEPHDVVALQSPAPGAIEIKRISERHHALARALAAGLSEAEAAASVGYDNARVSVLKASPAFRELLDLYRDKVDTEFSEIAGRLAGLTKDALVALQDRLEDQPEDISVGQLIEIAKLGADRSGFGPSQKVEQTINVNLAARMQEARKRLSMRDVTPDEGDSN